MKVRLLFLINLFLWMTMSNGQSVIDTFDDSAERYTVASEGAPSSITFTNNKTDYVEGTGSMDAKFKIGSFHTWGSFASAQFRIPEGDPPMDWSARDTLVIWIKIYEAASYPEYMVFRACLFDQPSPGDAAEEYMYENVTILDHVRNWYELKIPMVERETDGNTIPDSTGLVLFPTNWGGGTYNNRTLDKNKLIGYNLEAVTSGSGAENLPADSLLVGFDYLALSGLVAAPIIFFNGKTLSANLSAWTWGQSSFSIEEGAGTNGTNALKWVQGDEYANGWTGIGFDVTEPYDMRAIWATDNVKFGMKAEEGVGDMRIQFEDGTGKVGTVFTPTADNEWHDYSLKLSEMVYQDETTAIDTSAITVVGLMAEATGVAGKVVYLDYFWTGNPIIDVVSPDPPTNVNAAPSADGYNLIYWTDVPGEVGETYTVYASPRQFSDLEAKGVEIIAKGVLGDVGQTLHYLFYPLLDKEVTNYYAVVCLDAAGNASQPAFSPAIVGTAKGIPTISLDIPTSFAVDGDLSEWYNSNIRPWVLKPETDNVALGTVTDSTDLMATVFLAIDDDNLYVAADVFDNVYHYGEGNWWDQDAFEFFIGLYDNREGPHAYIERGNEPDYKLQIHEVGIVDEFIGRTIWTPDDDLYFFTDYSGADYTIEAQIPLDSIAGPSDKRFHPKRGMKIPIELYFHDNDGVWEGNLSWSKKNDDHAWEYPTQWGYTWIGDTTDVYTAIDQRAERILTSYKLNQNYPNPFNLSTRIDYSIPRSDFVTLEVYNMLGQKVASLVNQYQNAGEYQITCDALDIPSGIYFYQIRSGSFNQTKKMLLLK
jgi:hypothetical protein